MARTRKKGWSYSTGERGRNRVRAFEHASGVLMIEFTDGGKRTRISLGDRNRERAKQEADEAAAKLAKAEDLKPEEPKALTLGELFDRYEVEVTPTKSERSRNYDRVAARMFEDFFGSDRAVCTLGRTDFDRFVRERSSGRVGPGRTAVGPRTVEYDLRHLKAVFNWATVAGDGLGGVLLERNRLNGFKMPREKNPVRVVLTDGEYRAMLAVADEVHPLFGPLLVVAHETGHRIGAVRQLRWSDIDWDADLIRWRAATEKTGYEHRTPVSADMTSVLKSLHASGPGIGEVPVFPSPKDPSRCLSRRLPTAWWKRAEGLAGLGHKRGRGWHSLRRKFASDLMHQPLKVLSALGGWKAPQTILMCYVHPDQDALRKALLGRGQNLVEA